MTCPIMQRELTVHLHNKNWYLRPSEDEEKILYPDSFTPGLQKKEQKI